MEYLQLSFENISFYNFFEPWYSFLNWKIDRKIEQIFINIPIILTDEKMTFYRFNFLDKGNVMLSIEEKVSSKKITLSNRHVFLCLSFSCSEETGAEVPLLEGQPMVSRFSLFETTRLSGSDVLGLIRFLFSTSAFLSNFFEVGTQFLF